MLRDHLRDRFFCDGPDPAFDPVADLLLRGIDYRHLGGATWGGETSDYFRFGHVVHRLFVAMVFFPMLLARICLIVDRMFKPPLTRSHDPVPN